VFLSFQRVASIQLLFLHWFSICFLSVSFPCNLANPHLYSSSPFQVRGYVDIKTVLYRLSDAGATEGWWWSGWPPVVRVWEQLVLEVYCICSRFSLRGLVSWWSWSKLWLSFTFLF
jgi:hypothetical protein